MIRACNLCPSPVYAKALCGKHYHRFKRTGSTDLSRTMGCEQCTNCGTHDSKHWRKGLCDLCYSKQYFKTYVRKLKYYQFAKEHNKAYTRLSKQAKHDFVLDFLSKNANFPYPCYTKEQLLSEWNKLKEYKDYSVDYENKIFYLRDVGLKIPSHFHPEIFDVVVDGKSLIEVFNDKEELYKMAHRGLGIDYPHTSQGLLSILKNWHGTQFAHHFRPILAKWFVENYCSKTLLDFSAGFGSRMIGTLAANKLYVGIDPNKITQFNNEGIINLYNMQDRVVLYAGCAEDVIPNLEFDVDCIFSCPPYFTKELYSDDDNQSVNRYKDYSTWKYEFMEKVIFQCRVKWPNATIGIVVSNIKDYPISDDVYSILTKYWDNVEKWKVAGVKRATSKNSDRFKYEDMYICK